MNNNKIDYFSVLVIGEKPDEQISVFDDMSNATEPYVLYYYKDKDILRKNKIKFYEEFLKQTKNKNNKNFIADKLNDLKSITDDEYYMSIGELRQFDKDKNIISDENINGKYITCEKGGRIFSNYLKDNNLNDTVSSKKNNINWGLIHKNKFEIDKFKRTWELCVEKNEPKNSAEKTIVQNMKPHLHIFDNFKDKQQYIDYNTSFFTDVVVLNGGWYEVGKFDYNDWVIGFYNTFIEPLKENDLITIYECTK